MPPPKAGVHAPYNGRMRPPGAGIVPVPAAGRICIFVGSAWMAFLHSVGLLQPFLVGVYNRADTKKSPLRKEGSMVGSI